MASFEYKNFIFLLLQTMHSFNFIFYIWISLQYAIKLKQIKAYLNKIAIISDLDLSFFISKLQRRVILKKEIFLKVNEIENYISFIESGIVRLFIPNENPDKETTFGFSFKNQFISAYDSFLT